MCPASRRASYHTTMRVCEYRDRLLESSEEISTMRELEQLFKGLADQTRLRILNLLIHGELCVCEIQYVLESSQPNVSRHLIYLKNSGLVLDRREGARMYYQLAQPNE